MKYGFIFLLSFACAFALNAQVTTEISGNLEAQGRFSKNNEQAQEDLFQRWDKEEFYLFYGNLHGKIEKGKQRFESNLFFRHSHSDLYKNDYFATRIFTFPNRLVARDLFRLQSREESDSAVTETVLNKFYYQFRYRFARVMMGRMYINYGQGEIFNPINPFNQPTGLTSISQVAQGNDGVSVTLFKNRRHTWNFYFLGDKSEAASDEDLATTIWLHGEYIYSDKLQLDYVGGQDQDRYKAGGQISYKFEDSIVFLQGLYQSEFIDNDPSNSLIDSILGYDEQLTGKWHVRIEGGYQKKNKFVNLASFGERFLPTEYFVAIANQYEIHPLIKLSGTVINDVKSGFTYLIAKSTFDLGHNMEADIFGYVPASKGDETENPAQKLVTTDYGLAFRMFF